METDLLTKLLIKPEEYDLECYRKLDYSKINCRMADVERRIINGLIRYYRPRHLLELGVLYGGGTCNLLNAISDMPDASLLSIDITNASDFSCLGENAKRIFPDFIGNKWTLVSGKDASEVLDCTTNTIFDFAVIDTAHVHPVESLNFLTILPYLKDGALVVLHDIEEGLDKPTHDAPRILFSSVVAPKMMPRLEYIINDIPGAQHVINLAVFQITSDTRKYIKNVFYSLALPWACNNVRIKPLTSLFSKHYDDELVRLWRRYYGVALTKQLTNNSIFDKGILKSKLDAFSCRGKVIFYGAGRAMKDIIDKLELLDIKFNFPIWDMRAEEIGSLLGHPVSRPNLDALASVDKIVVVTILDEQVASDVSSKLAMLGYTVIRSSEFFEKIRKSEP